MAWVVWRKCKVEWKSLQKAFDDFVAPPLWVCTLTPFKRYALLRSWALGLWGEFDVNDEANKLTYQKLVQALPLKASGSKMKLLALLGRTRFCWITNSRFGDLKGTLKGESWHSARQEWRVYNGHITGVFGIITSLCCWKPSPWLCVRIKAQKRFHPM